MKKIILFLIILICCEATASAQTSVTNGFVVHTYLEHPVVYPSQEHPLGNAGHAGFYDGPHFDINEDGSDNVFFGAYFNRWGAFTDTDLLPSNDLAFGTFQREGDTMIFQNIPPSC